MPSSLTPAAIGWVSVSLYGESLFTLIALSPYLNVQAEQIAPLLLEFIFLLEKHALGMPWPGPFFGISGVNEIESPFRERACGFESIQHFGVCPATQKVTDYDNSWPVFLDIAQEIFHIAKPL
jgi:hypothetical protein